VIRRELLKATAIWTAASYSRVSGANDRIRIAGLGVGGRATYLLGLAAKAENTASADLVFSANNSAVDFSPTSASSSRS